MRKFHLLLAVTVAFITHITAQTNGITTPVLKEAAPEAAGMSTDRLARIDQLFKEYVDKKWLPSVTAMIVRDGKIVYYKTAGYDNPDKKSSLHKGDIYRIASQSKAITSVAVMILYEEGRLLLDDPISKYIPEFKKPQVLDSLNMKDTTYTTKPAKREITIRDLLTHTSGIGYAQIGDDKMNAIYGKQNIPSGIGVEPGGDAADFVLAGCNASHHERAVARGHEFGDGPGRAGDDDARAADGASIGIGHMAAERGADRRLNEKR